MNGSFGYIFGDSWSCEERRSAVSRDSKRFTREQHGKELICTEQALLLPPEKIGQFL